MTYLSFSEYFRFAQHEQEGDAMLVDRRLALIYDHFTPMVLMQLEDYGFCKKGEGGPFVLSGAIRYAKKTARTMTSRMLVKVSTTQSAASNR